MNRRLRPLSPLNQFILLVAAIPLVGGGFLGWWMDRRIVQVVIADNVTMAGVFVDSTIAPHLAELASLDAISPAQEAHLTQLMRNNVDSGRYVAISVWSPEGKLVFSTLDDHVPDADAQASVAQALAGGIVTRRTGTIAGQPTLPDGSYLEAYFKVQAPFTGEPLGVVSFVQDLSSLQRSILFVRLQTWLVVGTATAVMFFLLFGIVRQWNDTIESQRAALARSRQQIQQAAVRAAALNEASMRRLGSDLHDGPAQDLGIALMRMEPLRAAVEAHVASGGQAPVEAETAAFDLQLIHTALQSSLQEIRNMAAGLRLPELSSLDVAQSIGKAARDHMAKTGRSVEVTGPDSVAGSDAVKSAAYRIVQEALNNGYRHGNPNHQGVRFSSHQGTVTIEVSDDGCGFDPGMGGGSGPRRQLGLAGLQERSEILGGQFQVRSSPGKGTVVRVVLPLLADAPASPPNIEKSEAHPP